MALNDTTLNSLFACLFDTIIVPVNSTKSVGQELIPKFYCNEWIIVLLSYSSLSRLHQNECGNTLRWAA